MTLSQQAPLVERPHSAKCLGERFQDAFLAAWGQERGVAYADLPAEAQAKWNRAAVAFVCTLSDAPSEAAARITELEAANGRLARLGRAVERERDEGFARSERAEARCRALESASPAEPSGWRPMESAPRDGTYILARVAPRDGDDRWGYLAGRCFVIRHEGRTPSGYDLGWSVFPGFGVTSDNWFEGWRPLPPTSEGGGA